MVKKLPENIIDEGFGVLKEHLGIAKTAIFLEMIGKGQGDSLEEIESKTEEFSKEDALKFIEKCKREKKELWNIIKVA